MQQVRVESAQEAVTRASSFSDYFSLVKFSHSVFALPFALSMAVLCYQRVTVSALQIIAIVIAMVAARTAAMAFNRLIDRDFDKLNPRTAIREIPAGILTPGKVRSLILLSSAIFIGAAAVLGVHCLVMAPAVLGWLFLYSYCKRFTPYAHLVLGVALGLAPGAVWYALIGTVAWEPVPLMIGVTLWVSGFDIIYACQDVEFDRGTGLHSIPQRLGVAKALTVSRVLHTGALISFAIFGWVFSLGVPFWIGFVLFAALIASQHRLVSPQDLSRVDAAFFTRNGLASVGFLAAVLIDIVL